MLVVSKMKVCAILCLSLLRFTVHAGIARRDTAPDGYYVYSSREGCVSVNSTEPCPVTWKIPTVFSISYSTQNEIVNDTILPLILDKLVASNVCKESLKKTLCSQMAPRCLDEGRRLDFGDVNSTCQKIYDSCPKDLADIYKKQNLCDNFVTGVHQRFKCVEASKPIKGGCPQPKYKMPSHYLSSYESQSENLNATFEILEGFKYSNATRFFSSVCLSELKKLSCTSLHCSADEKYLLTAYNRTECSNWIKECFSGDYPAKDKEAITTFKTSYEAICKIHGAAYAAPSAMPSAAPSATPSAAPSATPSATPSGTPSSASSHLPQFLLLIVSLFLKVFI